MSGMSKLGDIAPPEVVDLHNDLILLVDHFDQRGRSDYFGEFWLPQLRAGGVGVQVLPIYLDPVFQSEGALRRTLLLVERIHTLAEHYPEVVVCRTGVEIADARAHGRIAIVIALEGAHALGQDAALIRTMYRVGVRVVSLAHLGRTHLADGSALDGSSGGGLTPEGVRVLAEMERLGMLFDVSHLGLAGMDDVLSNATRPLFATHSGCRAVRDVHRNITDEHLRGIGALGGVVGVAAAIPPYMNPTTPDAASVVDHIEHVASVTSIDAVGLGPDFVDDYFTDIFGGWHVPGMEVTWSPSEIRRPSDLHLVSAEMRRRGFTETDVAKVMGGNARRVLENMDTSTDGATTVSGPPTPHH